MELSLVILHHRLLGTLLEDVELDAAILLAALVGLVVGDRLVGPEALRDQALGLTPLPRGTSRTDSARCCDSLRLNAGRAGRVGVTLDLDELDLRVVDEHAPRLRRAAPNDTGRMSALPVSNCTLSAIVMLDGGQHHARRSWRRALRRDLERWKWILLHGEQRAALLAIIAHPSISPRMRESSRARSAGKAAKRDMRLP